MRRDIEPGRNSGNRIRNCFTVVLAVGALGLTAACESSKGSSVEIKTTPSSVGANARKAFAPETTTTLPEHERQQVNAGVSKLVQHLSGWTFRKFENPDGAYRKIFRTTLEGEAVRGIDVHSTINGMPGAGWGGREFITVMRPKKDSGEPNPNNVEQFSISKYGDLGTSHKGPGGSNKQPIESVDFVSRNGGWDVVTKRLLDDGTVDTRYYTTLATGDPSIEEEPEPVTSELLEFWQGATNTFKQDAIGRHEVNAYPTVVTGA